jgi:ribosomal protein S18 acetylase RimI-like enzyme
MIETRSMRRGDEEEVAAIARLAFASLWPAAELLLLIDQHPNVIARVAVDGDLVNGFVIAELRGYDIVIKALAVHPDVARRGYGRRMVQNLADKLVKTNRRRVVMHVRETNALGMLFAQGCGMVPGGRVSEMFFDLELQAFVDGLVYQRPVYDEGARVIEAIMAGEA